MAPFVDRCGKKKKKNQFSLSFYFSLTPFLLVINLPPLAGFFQPETGGFFRFDARVVAVGSRKRQTTPGCRRGKRRQRAACSHRGFVRIDSDMEDFARPSVLIISPICGEAGVKLRDVLM